MLSNANATHFCGVFFRHRAVFPACNKKNSVESQKVVKLFPQNKPQTLNKARNENKLKF